MKLQDLKLDYPVKNHTISQGFGKNFNGAYARDGLKGHPAIDFDVDFNSPIYSVTRGQGRVYKTFNKDNSDLTKYRAVCEILDLEDCSLEITYGHCNKITCTIGQYTGQIATVGNTGEVYSGTHLVTDAEKKAGSTSGRHLHFQIRKCQRVLKSELGDFFLQDSNGIYIDNGYYYTWRQNGFNGCLNPLPYLENGLDKSLEKILPVSDQIIENIKKSDLDVKSKISFFQSVLNMLKSLLH